MAIFGPFLALTVIGFFVRFWVTFLFFFCGFFGRFSVLFLGIFGPFFAVSSDGFWSFFRSIFGLGKLSNITTL